MKPGRGKSKGSSFERQIAKALSLWLTNDTDSTQLIRSVLSGGWTRGQLAGSEGWRHVGDLAPNGPAGEAFRLRWAVECKHHRTIDLYGLWTRTKNKDSLIGWWRKLQTDSAAAGGVWTDVGGRIQVRPMLIFRANGRPIMVGLQRIWADGFMEHAAIFYPENLVIFPFHNLLKSRPEWFLSR